MGIDFTEDQKKVIDRRGCNVLVSAAAGSGKTAVLVERIVRMVCDENSPVDIDRLLVVTFTNAAASEMRERVANGIEKALEENPASTHIARQATLLHNAQITTIDSFCLFLVRNHFNEIGLDPVFRIADEGEIKLLAKDCLEELFEEGFASEDEAFRNCIEFFCPDGKEDALEDHIKNLSKFADSFPWPEEWIKERKQDYAVLSVQDFADTEAGKYLLKYLNGMAAGWLRKMQFVRMLCEMPAGPHMYGARVDAEIEIFEKMQGPNSLEAYEAALIDSKDIFKSLPSKSDPSVSVELRDQAKNIRDGVKRSYNKLREDFFPISLFQAMRQGRDCEKAVETLLDLTLAFRERMDKKKRERKIVTFPDIEHFALNILLKKEGTEVYPTAVAKEYRKHFSEVLIDEYQDSNMVQEFLLKAVSGEDDGNFNRFMVGDVKQSIYRFRLARPEIFLEKYKTYQAEGSEQRIDLSMNFRSRTQVVESVNQVFQRIMREETGGLSYDDKAALYFGAKYYPENQGTETEFLFAEAPAKGDDDSKKRREARMIARRIKELRSSFLVTDKKTQTLRPARYSDMVILLRSLQSWAEDFKAVFEEEGIPVFLTQRDGYFAAPEVQDLLNILRVLNNPRHDIPLFGVLKSRFGGFSEEEIARIKIAEENRRAPLFAALQNYAAQGGEENLKIKTVDFLEKIANYRSCAVYLSVRELLTKLILDHDYLNYVTAQPAGERKRANVEMLLVRASDFEKTSYFGLFSFIRYIDQLEKYKEDFGEAALLDENADVVRIMTIHSSKGLEFPITFVGGMQTGFSDKDKKNALAIDMDLGLGVVYVDAKRRIRNKTLRKNVLVAKMWEEMLSEELRLLYVAMTRAKEKLILTACIPKAEDTLASALENPVTRLEYDDFVGAKSYLDFCLPILGNTGIVYKIYSDADFFESEVAEQTNLRDLAELLTCAEELVEDVDLTALRERFAKGYAHENLAGLYTKTTVSELKIAAMADKDEAAFHAFEEKEVASYVPTFRRKEEKISGSTRGNAYHRVMELLPFATIRKAAAGGEKEAFEVFMAKATAQGRLSEEYAGAVSRRKIVNFLNSTLGERMARAEQKGKLHREQPFVLGLSASRLGSEFPAEETVLIQGIIDAYWEEDGEIVLLDYKTDAVESMQELQNRYETQLDYYKEALEKLTGLPVKECILYSFHLEEF